LRTFTPNLDILPEHQRELWPGLAACKDLEFVLYGGTAIALHLGHRASVDFDFFSHAPLDGKKEAALMEALPFLNDSERIQHAENTRSYLTETNVKLSFFGDIRLGRVGEPLLTNDNVLQVASLDDLMAMKLATVLKRVEVKDYIDVAAMIRDGADLRKGLAGAAALYGKQFPPAESVKALTYFSGGDLEQLRQADRKTLLSAAQSLSIRGLPHVSRISGELTGGSGITDIKQASLFARQLLNIPHAIATSAMPGRRYEGEILGVTGDKKYAVMRLSENQAVIHTLAPGQTPPEVRKRAVFVTDSDGISSVQNREDERAQTRGIKR
jgi:hypothetical protein